MDFYRVEKEIISQLKSSGLIEKFQVDSVFETPNLNRIIELFKNPTKIKVNKFGIYIDSEGNDIKKEYIPDMRVTISEKGEWLSDYLPEVNFDIEQSGVLMKAEEAEALYIAMQIAQFYKEDVFINEIKSISKNYNYKDMIPLPGYRNHRTLINDWIAEFPSNNMKILISACRFKISDRKKNQINS
jgi:hypothetical protein